MNRISYIPAMSPTLTGKLYTLTLKDGIRVPATWWHPESIYQHGVGLFSTYFGLTKKIGDFRKHIGLPDDFHLIGDSGGFQALSLGVTLDPLDILRWQEKNCQTAATLDVPPFKKVEGGQKKGQSLFGADFIKCAERSAEFAHIAMDKRENHDMDLHVVLHGTNLTDMEVWRNTSIKGYEDRFEGYALAFNPKTAYASMSFLAAYQEQYLQKPVHVFQVGSPQRAIALLWLFRHSGHKVTFDATSYSAGSRFRQYTILGLTKFRVSNDEELMPIDKRPKKLPCWCPICSQSRVNEILFSEEEKLHGTEVGLCFDLHNLWWMISVYDNIFHLLHDEETCWRVMKSILNEKNLIELKRVDRLLEIARVKGVETMNKRQRRLTDLF